MEEGLNLQSGPTSAALDITQYTSPPGVPQTLTSDSTMAPSDLQLIAQQASGASHLPDDDSEQSKENASPSLPMAPITIPITSTHRRSSQHLSPTYDLPTTNHTSHNASFSGFAPATPPEQSRSPLPDMIDQQFRDAAYGASQQYPAESIAESQEPQIQAFAKLEFGDGEFYMNTYAIELGRDIKAAREASERGSGSAPKSGKPSVSRVGSVRSENSGKEHSGSIPGSVISDGEGVIVDRPSTESGKKSRRNKSKSWSSSSQPQSRDSMQFVARRAGEPKTDYNALAMESLANQSAETNGFAIEAPTPSPELVPLIPIHPPTMADGDAPGHKSISRKHIRIAFNFQNHLFQVEILGRNGVFIDDHWYPPGGVVPLVNGSMIQIGAVGVRFILPEALPSDTVADMGVGFDDDPLSGGRMNFDMAESDEEESEEEDEEEDDITEVKQEEGEGPELSRTRAKGKKKTEAPPPVPAKRKGPGRPPKNGIISKREQALLARQAKEEAKAKAEGKPVPVKGKVCKDSKEPKQEETSVQPNGKRKYVKRKRAGGTEDPQAVRESTGHTESVPPEQVALPPKPAKEKKPPKPPRSPSPVFDESKMTPEQLAKPQSSYVVLIHDALTNSKTGQMSLPQIYRAIERQYPYYKLRVQTQGWQSSVRHNLSQHPAFRKIERDGKGWMWGLVPEVSIEKEKKRRTTPPPQVSQQHYYAPNPMMQHSYPYPGMPLPNGHMPPSPYGLHPGAQPNRMPYPPPPRHGFPPLVNAQSESTYRSPYQSTPPPATSQPTPQIQQLPQANATNGHYPTPVSQPPLSQSSTNLHQANGSGPCTSPSLSPQQPSASSVACTAASEAPTNISHQPDVDQTVSAFKSALVKDMDGGEAMVTSAINRVIGIQDESSLPGKEDSKEKTIMNAFSSMLGDLSKQNMEGKQHSHQSIASTDAAQSLERSTHKSERPTITAIAADNAAKTALANSDITESSAPGVNEVTGNKRPSNEVGPESAGQRGAKRLAS